MKFPFFSFAEACEVSSDGERINCQCTEGYIGVRCQSCAPGFYGKPEQQGKALNVRIYDYFVFLYFRRLL